MLPHKCIVRKSLWQKKEIYNVDRGSFVAVGRLEHLKVSTCGLLQAQSAFRLGGLESRRHENGHRLGSECLGGSRLACAPYTRPPRRMQDVHAQHDGYKGTSLVDSSHARPALARRNWLAWGQSERHSDRITVSRRTTYSTDVSLLVLHVLEELLR